jgi:hypothetical protein
MTGERVAKASEVGFVVSRTRWTMLSEAAISGEARALTKHTQRAAILRVGNRKALESFVPYLATMSAAKAWMLLWMKKLAEVSATGEMWEKTHGLCRTHRG